MTRLILAVCGLALVGSSVSGQDGLPIAATVRIDRIESKQSEHEARIAKLERENAELRGMLKPVSTPVAKPVTSVTLRNPLGHTHTCPNCGDTWDHSKNPTHVCQICGVSVYVVDSPSRMVQVRNGQSAPVQSVPVQQATYSVQTYSIGGCSNGQCDSSYGYRRGLLFRRW